MRKLIAVFAVLSLAIALSAAGCGGGGDSEGGELDKASFVKQANEICERASGKMAAGVNTISSRESAKPNYDYDKTQLLLVTESLIPGLEEELREIRALGVPDDAKAEAEAFLKAYQKSIDKTKANPQTGLEIVPPYESVELIGTKMGATECPVSGATGS